MIGSAPLVSVSLSLKRGVWSRRLEAFSSSVNPSLSEGDALRVLLAGLARSCALPMWCPVALPCLTLPGLADLTQAGVVEPPLKVIMGTSLFPGGLVQMSGNYLHF